MSERSDEAFVERARALLDESEASLTPDVTARLTQMRREAVALSEARGSYSLLQPLMPAGAMAATLSAVVAFWLLATTPLPSIYEDESQQLAAEDMELLEDLEFVAWMIVEESEFDAG
ncbi:MAG: hypothetical protein V3U43_05665 [Pseudomonadales bacterium]